MIWVELAINGVFLGMLYAMFGLGLSLIFGVMRIANIAHGELVVAGAFLAFLGAGHFGLNPFQFIVPIGGLMFALGWLLQSQLVNRVHGADPIPSLLLTFGVSIIAQNAMVLAFGANTRSIDVGALKSSSVTVLGLELGVLPLITSAIALLVFGGLHLVLTRTRIGRNIRGAADDPEVLRMFGINPKRVFALVMAISAVLAAIAGVLMAMRTTFTPFSGAERLLLAFEVVVIGGLGSIRATLVGGILIGVVHVFSFRFDPASGLVYGHILLILVLLLKPSGIAGKKVTR